VHALLWHTSVPHPRARTLRIQVLFSVMQNHRPEVPPESELPGKPGVTLERYKALMARCWHEDDSARPSFEEVLAELDELRAEEIAAAKARGDSSTATSLAATPR
jgi:hypothetical protein